MRLFLSAGEPSGDVHGANLIRQLRERRPDLQFVGFGGERMTAAGCELLYPLCDLAVVGIGAVIANIARFHHILGLARTCFQQQRPDAVVLIDYPGFHWWVAGCARQHAIPVSYFIPPQLWGWGGWRVKKMRRLTDQVLSVLPFETDWLQARGVPAQYVGHPYFDELAAYRLDAGFLAAQRHRPGIIVAILPGSRRSELRQNLASQVEAARIIHARRPDVRFLVACLRSDQADWVRQQLAGSPLPVEVHHGKTPEIIHLAHSCMSVSGSVSLELLYRGKPSTILYRVTPFQMLLCRLLRTARFITLVNLLADRELFPEYVDTRNLGDKLAGHILHWLSDRTAYEELCGQLAQLRTSVVVPGACQRAATAILQLVDGQMRQAA
jgi:lipid-A-disaccharide synthase